MNSDNEKNMRKLVVFGWLIAYIVAIGVNIYNAHGALTGRFLLTATEHGFINWIKIVVSVVSLPYFHLSFINAKQALIDTGESKLDSNISCSACASNSMTLHCEVRSTILLLVAILICLIGIYLGIQISAPIRGVDVFGVTVFLMLAFGMNYFNKYQVYKCNSCGNYSVKAKYGSVLYPLEYRHLNNVMLYLGK